MLPFLPDLNSLTLAQQVAQMIVVRASGFLFDHQIQYPAWEPPNDTLELWLRQAGMGGVILLGGSAGEIALRTQQLQEWATIPLLMAADVEEGVGQRFAGATWFPPPMALSQIFQHHPDRALEYAEQMGATIAQESRAIGLNWVLAPVVDVNNNPDNPVINVRAFGDNPEIVSQLTTAFIRGAQQHPVLTAAKHFPGHGDTAIDSHLELPLLSHSWERLQQIELPPFIAAIAAGVDAVMSAHLQIPALDPDYPATLSQRILTQQLRKHLGFDGLIVTDALVMGAIANRYGANEAAVLAVAAGADILLMPADPVGAIGAVCTAVEEGRIALERIRASVERIWQAKQKVCGSVGAGTPHAWETLPAGVETELVSRLAQPGAIALAEKMVRDSMRVHLPVISRLSSAAPAGGSKRNLILVDNLLDCEFLRRHTPAIALPTAQGYQPQILDSHTPVLLPSDPSDWQPTLLQLFIRGNPFRGSAGLTQLAQDWLQLLLDSEQLQALAIYGSPYALDRFLPSLPAEVPYVFTYAQTPQAQAIGLETLFSQLQ
jgi:beta-glucosidase